jgi:hypothetical protein
MSTHPNVILACALKPDSTTRKTHREIMAEKPLDDKAMTDDITIGSKEYHVTVMEQDYDEASQISADEGDIVFWHLVTYGYGETIEWNTLKVLEAELEEWAKVICAKHHCSYRIFVTANYW